MKVKQPPITPKPKFLPQGVYGAYGTYGPQGVYGLNSGVVKVSRITKFKIKVMNLNEKIGFFSFKLKKERARLQYKIDHHKELYPEDYL